MRLILRGVGLALLLALFITPMMAQDDDTINVVGSRIVTDTLNAIAPDGDVTIEATGTSTGFELFCQGEAAATGANRPISVDEDALCLQNEVEYAEYLLGYDVIAVVAHPDLAVDCLSTTQLSSLFAPSAQGTATWVEAGFPEITEDLSLLSLPDNTTQYGLLDDLVEGVGLRADLQTGTDTETIASTVADTPGAVGLVNFANLPEDTPVKILELTNDEIGGCFAPMVSTVETRQYPGANRLLVYVNQAASGTLIGLLESAVTAEAVDVVTEAGLVPPSGDDYELNRTVLAGDETGRQFSLDVTAFEIPPTVTGAINVGGGADLITYLQSTTQQFNQQYPGVTFNLNLTGEPSGYRQLCNGEVSVIASTDDLPEDEAANCEANDIQTASFDIGAQGVVLVANAADDYLLCLSTEQLIDIWAAPAPPVVMAEVTAEPEATAEPEMTAEPLEPAPTNWTEISDTFDDETMFLFAPREGTIYTDLLLTPPDSTVLPRREDLTEANNDALYRAAAVANAEGTLTYMSWDEYVDVLDNNQENIQLVAVDGGDGCIAPSEETILDGTYPLSNQTSLIVNVRDVAQPALQSMLWYLFSDENYPLINQAGLVGPGFGELPMIRGQLEDLFAEAVAIAATPPQPEATPELTPEATAEATEAATPDATEEAEDE